MFFFGFGLWRGVSVIVTQQRPSNNTPFHAVLLSLELGKQKRTAYASVFDTVSFSFLFYYPLPAYLDERVLTCPRVMGCMKLVTMICRRWTCTKIAGKREREGDREKKERTAPSLWILKHVSTQTWRS